MRKGTDLQDPTKHGGWFCLRCQVFVSLDVSAEQSKCAQCRSPRVKWCPAIQNCKVSGRAVAMEFCHRAGPITVEDAHKRFDAMKKALG